MDRVDMTPEDIALSEKKNALLSYIKSDMNKCESTHQIYIADVIEPHQYDVVTDVPISQLIDRFNHYHKRMREHKRRDVDVWYDVKLYLECWGRGKVDDMKIMVVLVRAYEDDLLHNLIEVTTHTLDEVLTLFASCTVYDANDKVIV